MAEHIAPGGFSCPVPQPPGDRVLLSHGGGGRHMQHLLKEVFFKHFDHPLLAERGDSAVFPSMTDGSLAMTTDSYVIKPLFFPGGDIGSLAVHGTVNDLAVCGARPRYLSAGFIIEEGFPMADLVRIVDSMRHAADEVGAAIVTGDTKVVDRGSGDGLFVNVTGIGEVVVDPAPAPSHIRPGDRVLLSGDLGRHGIAVMAVREGLSFDTELCSDSGPIWPTVEAMLREGIRPHCMRDLTRGGLGAALAELAETTGLDIELDEAGLPVCEAVEGACEVLGLDPMFIANEGRFVAFVAPDQVADALAVMAEAHGDAAVIGEVHEGAGRVRIVQATGLARMLLVPTGTQLPRIC
ncbi:hydrogenase expression/formation protein HypE [Sulfidibacter corallicola]|uniref:Hydrogenase expression/formation protein HypE n=1 Tax=Sulfidibacter corallicola TaxID=2818388 RepID=A0A8A4TWY7_SULCO|nr:hydrogenase expression/formation protein HypE [Sulfidibacter corallicola]QTD53634.1 hydrogenase expression/formation protein HypE [Sulfidibacter corallicola]